MCSRSFTITLDAGRPDPEARVFSHPDPLEWTRASRPRILEALYTILVAGVRCRPSDVSAKTRFKTWWKLVGWAVENAAAVYGHRFDCSALTQAEEAEDAEALAIAELIGVCLRIWGGKPFFARDLVQQLPAEHRGVILEDKPKASELSEALSEIVGKPFVRPTAKSVAKLLQKHVVDRSIWLPDGRHAVMRRKVDHDAHSYWIEVSAVSPRGGGTAFGRPIRKPWGSPEGIRSLSPDAVEALKRAGNSFGSPKK
jgi:hypothetical protein